MEEKPWLKSEFFAWHDGRRIVDLYELSKQMQCKQCRSLLDLRRTERETRYGLASVLYIACHCGVMNDVHTGRKQESGSDHCMANGGDGGNMYEVNIKASINLLMYGVGASRFLSFLALLDIPVPPPEDTSLIVPVTDDSGPMTGAPPNVPQNLPAFNAQAGYAAPPSGYNIPQSGYNYNMQPSSQIYSEPPQSQTSVSYKQTGSSASFMSGGISTSATHMPQTSASLTPTKELKVKDLPEASGDSQDVMFVSPLDDDSDEAEKALTRPVASKTKAAGAKLKGQTAKRGRGRGRGSTPRKPPSATQTSAKKKKVVSSDEEFVNPLEWPTSESESESDGKNSDTSWHASDQELGRKKSSSKRKSKDEDDDKEEEEEEVNEEGDEEEEEEENESDGEETDDSPKKGKRGRGKKKTDGGSGSSKTKKRRIRHERRQEEADNAPKCPDCDKIFSSIKSYNQHMKRVHDKEVKETREPVAVKVAVCPDCFQPISLKNSFQKHLVIAHLEKYESPEVRQKVVPKEMSLGDVLERRTFDAGNKTFAFYKCLRCPVQYFKAKRALMHVRVKENGTGLTCKAKNRDGQRISEHYISQLLTKELGIVSTHVCPVCGDACPDIRMYHAHVASHKRFVCEVCGKSLRRRGSWRRHMSDLHPEGPKERNSVCDLCGKTFLSERGLRVHRSDSHFAVAAKCQVCNMEFRNKRRLASHMRAHSDHRPHTCSLCGLSFKRPEHMKAHQRRHTGEKPFKCDQCETAFIQLTSLKLHKKNHHK